VVNLCFGFAGSLARYSKDLNRLQRIIDPFVVGLVYWLLNESKSHLALTSLPVLLLLTVLILPSGRLYESYRRASLLTLLRRLTTSWLLVVGGFLLWAFAFKVSAELSRQSLFLWALGSWSFLSLVHVGGRKFLRYQRKQGRNSRSILYVGSQQAAISFYNSLRSGSYLGLTLSAWFSADFRSSNILPAGMPSCRGSLSELVGYLERNTVDMIVFSDVATEPHSADRLVAETMSIGELVRILGNSCIPAFYAPTWIALGVSFRLAQLGSQPCLELWSSRDSLFDRQLKRGFDLVVAGFALALLSPLLLLIALAIRLTSRGPVLFFQDRYGLDGKCFRLIKFRSMFCQEAGDLPGLRQATRHDSRITPVGSFLRRTSLDELPQLCNVLLGQMSIVGPRPHAVAHNELYRHQINGYMKRHMFKPGITGLAQVRGLRGETTSLESMANRVQADLEYQRDWSLSQDIKILIKTLFCFVSPHAY